MIALDTNIFVYAIGEDSKAPIARRCVLHAAATGGIIPLQVFCEFSNVARRKQMLPLEAVRAYLADWMPAFRTTPTAEADVGAAAELADRRGLQYFDALIAVVSRRAGANMLLSEDLQDGADLAGCRVINPFAHDNTQMLEMLFAA